MAGVQSAGLDRSLSLPSSASWPSAAVADEVGFASVLNGGAAPQSPMQDGVLGSAAASPARGSEAPASGAAIGSSPSASAASSSASSLLKGDAPVPSIDGSKFQSADALKQWGPLVQGLPPSQQRAAEKALNRPLAAARMLASGDPSQKAAATAYLDANPSIKAALDTASKGGKPDGVISDGDVKSFISNMSKQLGRAANTMNTYQKKNPDTDGQSLQLVRQSALLQANLPLTRALSRDKDGNVGGDTTRAGLQSMARDPGLSLALRGAASTFAQPGMFQVLDQGGKTGVALATSNPDDKFDERNIIDWVKKQAPTSGGQFASVISDAATRNAVANVDTSKLGADVFANPQRYSAAQKAAVLVQLQTMQQQLQGGKSLRHSDKTDNAIQQKIAQLSGDPDVQSFLAQETPANEKAIVNSDPSLANAVQGTYAKDVVTGQALQTGLDLVTRNNADKGKTKQTDGSAVSDFSQEAQLDSDLSDGRTVSAAAVIGGNATLTGELQGDYEKDFSQGGELRQLQGQKDADLGTSLQTLQGDEQSFEGVLDPNFVQAHSGAYTRSTSMIAMQDGGSGKAVTKALTEGGNADTSDIAESIARLDPQQLYGSTRPGLTSSDTQSLVTSFLHDLSGGSSVSDACAKFNPDNIRFDPNASDPAVMAKLEADPSAARAVQTLFQSLSHQALGLPIPGASAAGAGSGTGGGVAAAGAAATGASGAATEGNSTSAGVPGGVLPPGFVPGSAASQSQSSGGDALRDLSYTGMGMMGGQMMAVGAGYLYGKRSSASDADKAAMASKIKIGGDVLGGVGGAIAGATLLPDVSEMLKNGQTTEAALSIGAGARGIVQGGALVGNLGEYGARAAGLVGSGAAAAYTGDGLGRLAGAAAGRVAGAVAGEATGLAVGEAIGAAAGPIGWAIDAALGVGFVGDLISQAVKKAHERKDMDATVDPILKQYGIARPS